MFGNYIIQGFGIGKDRLKVAHSVFFELYLLFVLGDKGMFFSLNIIVEILGEVLEIEV